MEGAWDCHVSLAMIAKVNWSQKIKMIKQSAKNVVRGFSLVPGWDCTTLEGRTTTAFGVWRMRLPRTFQVLAMTKKVRARDDKKIGWPLDRVGVI